MRSCVIFPEFELELLLALSLHYGFALNLVHLMKTVYHYVFVLFF